MDNAPTTDLRQTTAMRNILKYIVMIPYGIMMSGPFAVYGVIGGIIGGFILGVIVGKFVL